jgi:hypothetical protein
MTPPMKPLGLLGVALLACLTAAVFGAAPLAAWVDGSVLAGTVAQQAADGWLETAGRLGLTRPYESARRAVRAIEGAH